MPLKVVVKGTDGDYVHIFSGDAKVGAIGDFLVVSIEVLGRMKTLGMFSPHSLISVVYEGGIE